MPMFSTFILPDGVKLAYQLFNAEARATPMVYVCGMSSTRGDSQRLVNSLAKTRPVLIYDHRGIGDSMNATPNEEVTIESMARDLLLLIRSFSWPKVAVTGFSMGGVITQQLMFLPFHRTNPTPLGFDITHVFLTATLASPSKAGSATSVVSTKGTTTADPRSAAGKRDIVRPSVERSFDPVWVADPANASRLNWWLDRMIVGRPLRAILKQAQALDSFNFTAMHSKIPASTKIMVIHGHLDIIVPYYESEAILALIPWATPVPIGLGGIPSLEFGHHWFEYFEEKIWFDVFENFMNDSPTAASRL